MFVASNRVNYGLDMSCFMAGFQLAIDHDVSKNPLMRPLVLNNEPKKETPLCTHGKKCFLLKRVNKGRGSKGDIVHCDQFNHVAEKKLTQSHSVKFCENCAGYCNVRLCRNGDACSRHKRVIAYRKNKKNEVSVEDMEHEKKFIHGKCVHCGTVCCGQNCGMYYGVGIPPCSTYDDYDDYDDDENDDYCRFR